MCKYFSCRPPWLPGNQESARMQTWIESEDARKRSRVCMFAHGPALISQDAPAPTGSRTKKATGVKAVESTTPSLSAHNRANVSGPEQLRVAPQPALIWRRVNFFSRLQMEKYCAEDQRCLQEHSSDLLHGDPPRPLNKAAQIRSCDQI